MAIGDGSKRRRSMATEEPEEGGSESTGESKRGGWFSQGRDAARGHVQRSNAEREAQKGRFALDFWMKDGEEALIRFREDEPVTYYEHSITVNGKRRPFTCPGEDVCPACKKGIKRRWRAAYNVIDYRTWKDKKGVEHSHDVKVYKCGKMVFEDLDKIDRRYGLTSRDLTICRTGAGLDTKYTWFHEDPADLSREDRNKDLYDLLEVLAPLEVSKLSQLVGGDSPDTDFKFEQDDNND